MAQQLMTPDEVATILVSRYCVSGQDDIQATGDTLERSRLTADGWQSCGTIGDARVVASLLYHDDWDAIDRMIGRHFRDRTWRQPKTPAGTYTI
jgi:hypothetical protein